MVEVTTPNFDDGHYQGKGETWRRLERSSPSTRNIILFLLNLDVYNQMKGMQCLRPYFWSIIMENTNEQGSKVRW